MLCSNGAGGRSHCRGHRRSPTRKCPVRILASSCASSPPADGVAAIQYQPSVSSSCGGGDGAARDSTPEASAAAAAGGCRMAATASTMACLAGESCCMTHFSTERSARLRSRSYLGEGKAE